MSLAFYCDLLRAVFT